jgi:hypothetical protein
MADQRRVLNNSSQQNVRIVHASTACTAYEHAVSWTAASAMDATGATGQIDPNWSKW